jgi:hypothetical protein
VSYTSTTLSELSAEIVNTLSDPNGVYWDPSEVTLAIQEAMRDWGLKTAYWRERATFNVVRPASVSPAKYFYDLSAEIPTLRPRTVTIDSILTEIQHHFLEAASGYSGSGLTNQFTIAEMIQAVTAARNQFCLDVVAPLTLTPALTALVDVSGRFSLPEDTIFCHRLMWKDGNGAFYPIYRSDGYAMDAANPNWTISTDRPTSFSQAETRPIEIQLNPIPVSSGTLEMLSVESVASFATTDPLQVPDDYAHAIKYAAMSRLLSVDGDQANPFLVAYCNFRYEEVVQAARSQKTVLRVQLANKPIGLSPLYSLDTLRSGWHSTPGTPDTAACAGDLIAFSPVANGTYGVSLDVVRAAPVPVSAVDVIQMGPEEIARLVQYCQHYLSLKMSGTEFRQTFSLFDNYQKAAARRSGILSNQVRYLSGLFGQPDWDRAKNQDIGQPSAQPVLIGQGA